MSKHRLLWLCPEFTPYHETLFNVLAADPQISLRVEAMQGPSASHPFIQDGERKYEWSVSQVKGIDKGLLARVLSEKDAMVVVSSYLFPTLLKAMHLLAKNKRPFVYWTDTPLPQSTEWNSGKARQRSLLRRLARSYRLNWIFKHADKVLASGVPGVESVISLGCPKEKAMVFPYWVEISQTKPELKREIESPVLCAIGQLIYRKGYDIALRAFAKALDAGLSPKTKFIFAGEGVEKDSLINLSRELGIAEKVEFCGWLNSTEKRALLEKASLFVHPARWEPFGVVVLEAMERALPVLGSDKTCAVLDRIQQDISGMIHRTEDIEQLAQQINECLSCSEKLQSISLAARNKAEEWRPERALKIMKEILCNRPPRSL